MPKYYLPTGSMSECEPCHPRGPSGRMYNQRLEASCMLKIAPLPQPLLHDSTTPKTQNIASVLRVGKSQTRPGKDIPHTTVRFLPTIERRSCTLLDLCFNSIYPHPQPQPQSQSLVLREDYGGNSSWAVCCVCSESFISNHRLIPSSTFNQSCISDKRFTPKSLVSSEQFNLLHSKLTDWLSD